MANEAVLREMFATFHEGHHICTIEIDARWGKHPAPQQPIHKGQMSCMGERQTSIQFRSTPVSHHARVCRVHISHAEPCRICVAMHGVHGDARLSGLGTTGYQVMGMARTMFHSTMCMVS